LFRGLVWASFLPIAGVMLALRRRQRDERILPALRLDLETNRELWPFGS
jgi:hypothetical protein